MSKVFSIDSSESVKYSFYLFIICIIHFHSYPQPVMLQTFFSKDIKTLPGPMPLLLQTFPEPCSTNSL